MIPSLLQDFLVEEFKKIFQNHRLKNIKDEDSQLNIYPQFLPARKGQKDTDHYPFVIVRLADGEDPDEYSPNMCRVFIVIGVCDKDDSYQGYKDCLNIIHKIYDHFMSTKIFDRKYEINYPIKWNLTEEDYFPYFYGGIETNWQLIKITKNDELT